MCFKMAVGDLLLPPHLASTDRHCPEVARWFDLELQGYWFESAGTQLIHPYQRTGL
jgi:hypothetical protein